MHPPILLSPTFSSAATRCIMVPVVGVTGPQQENWGWDNNGEEHSPSLADLADGCNLWLSPGPQQEITMDEYKAGVHASQSSPSSPIDYQLNS